MHGTTNLKLKNKISLNLNKGLCVCSELNQCVEGRTKLCTIYRRNDDTEDCE
jgi:hypothetical protein